MFWRNTGDDLEVTVRYAVSQGGDTDTAAAITGGLRCRNENLVVGWVDRDILPDTAELNWPADGRHELKRAAYG